MPNTRYVALTLFACSLVSTCLQAQATNPDAHVVGAAADSSSAATAAAAWERLQNGVTGTKNTNTRIAAIAGMSLLGGDARAEKIVRGAMSDADVDVKLAAIVAAGEMGMAQGARSSFALMLRNMLGDADPKVAFTTASTLWKMNDPSGEDILIAVAQGERSADYSFWKGSKHNASRTLHDPIALARIGATQGLMILVPPVGIGMGAYGYLRSPAGASPQVVAITQIATQFNDLVRATLINATKDKDSGARVAAAEALTKYRGDDVRAALQAMLSDSKENVAFTASAAYIRVATQPAAPARTTPVKH